LFKFTLPDAVESRLKRKQRNKLTRVAKFDTLRKFVLKRHELLSGLHTG
jgi:hypothetical protein